MSPSSLPTLPLRRVENTLSQLLAEMHSVVEAHCVIHGVSGTGFTNAASTLLPMIGLEVIAERTNDNEHKEASIRRVFRELAAFTGVGPYGTVGFGLFTLTRHGVAHGFYPNETVLANGPRVSVSVEYQLDTSGGRTICVKDVDRSRAGHLAISRLGDLILLSVIPQLLFIDVESYVSNFLKQLASDRALQQVVERNDERMLASANERARENLKEADFIALGV